MSSAEHAHDPFRALAEPRRRAILRLLSDREMAAGAIAEEFDVTRPAISQHLSVLRDAGLISERREGTRRLYRIDPRRLDDLRSFLDEVWGGALARAARLAEGSGSGRAEAG